MERKRQRDKERMIQTDTTKREKAKDGKGDEEG